MDPDHGLEKLQTHPDLPRLHEGEQEVDPFLTQPVETGMPSKCLFALLEHLAAHVDKFNLAFAISIQKVPHSL